MSEIKDGGPAFPVVTGPYEDGSGYGHWEGESKWQFGGLTMRDYFAAKAMQGMRAYPGCASMGSHHNNNSFDGVADLAYVYADAMIKARGES